MTNQPLRFWRRGDIVTLHDVPPTRTLLQVLREDLQCTGTKEGCGEGDCGACTVVLGQERNGELHTSAINSCIRLAHSVDGMALWTVEDLAQPSGSLHPAQQAMVQCHASQCGFCTPGFVMSLFALYQSKQGGAVTRAEAQQALSGNLCRCTGYRPILDAAQCMESLPNATLNEGEVLMGLAQLAQLAQLRQPQATTRSQLDSSNYLLPINVPQLLQARSQYPEAQLVAGCTDVGLWVTKLHQQFARVIDLSRVDALRCIEHYPHHLAIGAAVTLTDAFAALAADRPQLENFAQRFAGLPVRNAGTLGGNIANGSPIGDSMPLLIALGASVVLMRHRRSDSGVVKKRGHHVAEDAIAHRELLLEDLYTGYRSNVIAKDEVLAWIKVPKPQPSEFCRVYKISKRMEDDISAVCLALSVHLVEGRVQRASIGVGGVAATPVRARQTQAAMLGQPWSAETIAQAARVLQAEFNPISDMRASSAYRRSVLGSLMQRFWLQSQGQELVSIEEVSATTAHGVAQLDHAFASADVAAAPTATGARV